MFHVLYHVFARPQPTIIFLSSSSHQSPCLIVNPSTHKMIKLLGLNTVSPYHVLLFSAVFGATTFHSFVLSPIAFKTLKREEFGALQNKIFPGYFGAQTVAPLLLRMTAPYVVCPFGVTLLATSSIFGALNLFVLLPWCQRIKEERIKAIKEFGDDSEEVKGLNGQFGRAHGLSSLANLLLIASFTVYGLYMVRGLKA